MPAMEQTRISSPAIAIAVIGGSSPSAKAKRHAREVGRLLAKEGAILVCGGLGGVMGEACRGAREEGGVTVGILPGTDPREANPNILIPISTGMGYGRNIIVVRSGRAVIAIEGAYGTLSEIAHALGDGIPVVGLDTWEFSSRGKQDTKMVRATDPADAVAKALALAKAGRLTGKKPLPEIAPPESAPALRTARRRSPKAAG